MEKTLENSKDNKTAAIKTKSHIHLAYAGGIYIVGRAERDVPDAFSKIEKVPAKIGLIVNEEKTKIMLVTAKRTPRRKRAR